jgi:hypothetical protein
MSLADSGCKVAVHGPDLYEAESTAHYIRKHVTGADILRVAADFKSQSEVRGLADTIIARARCSR